MMNEKGKIATLPAVVIATLSLGLVASMYLNYAVYKNAQDDKRQTAGELTDLRYQVKQDQLAGLNAPSSSPSPSTKPTASPSPAAVLGAETLAISEMGVTVIPAAPLADLSYAVIPSQTAGAVVIGFKSDSFSTKYPNCAPGTALGQLVRRPVSQRPPASNKLVATIGGFKFYYYNPGDTCATSTVGRADTAAAVAVLGSTILKSIAQ
jgi:hypothetical protein